MQAQSPQTSETKVLPFLEHHPENDGLAQRVICSHFPFQIGRSETADHVIYSRRVSKEHAAIEAAAEGFTIRDLGSTNGTFVNGQRITCVPLREGDIIHVAHKEFRFGVMPTATPADTKPIHTDRVDDNLPISVIYGREVLQDILREQQVRSVFQPIVDLATGATMGYEALGRGTHDELSPNPGELFRLAEKCGMARQLSLLFRMVAFKEVAQLTGSHYFFFNVHPSEMEDLEFVNSLGEALTGFGAGRRMVLEVHENFVSDTRAMRRLRDRFDTLGVGLAYDDFGAGQARLTELAEVPPDFLKLDMKLIRGIDEASGRQDVVRALTEVSTRLGVRVIAEGVETAQEAECCRRLGCHWAQGFLFGHPLPADMLPPPKSADTKRVNLGPILERLRQRRG
jgi:EAL domain-containing protein (putative c-di-GMP-specific phosphodiesterase class I)